VTSPDRRYGAITGQSALSSHSALSGFFTQFKRMDISSKIDDLSLIYLVNLTCYVVYIVHPAPLSDQRTLDFPTIQVALAKLWLEFSV
jgi:hypothetical protein